MNKTQAAALKTAQADLLTAVDLASQSAPAEGDRSDWRRYVVENADAQNAPHLEFTAGAARFRVGGSWEALQRFADKVKRCQGFGPGRARAIGRDGGNGYHVPARATEAAARAKFSHMGNDDLVELLDRCRADVMRALKECANGRALVTTPDRLRWARDIEIAQREMVRRGLLDATDWDKVNAEPVQETIGDDVQDDASATVFAADESAMPVPAPRARHRWDDAAGAWVPVLAVEPAPPVPAGSPDKTLAAAVYPCELDEHNRFAVANPDALVPPMLLSPDGRYSCDGCEGLTDRAALTAAPAGYYCPACAAEPSPPVLAVEPVLPVPADITIHKVHSEQGGCFTFACPLPSPGRDALNMVLPMGYCYRRDVPRVVNQLRALGVTVDEGEFLEAAHAQHGAAIESTPPVLASIADKHGRRPLPAPVEVRGRRHLYRIRLGYYWTIPLNDFNRATHAEASWTVEKFLDESGGGWSWHSWKEIACEAVPATIARKAAQMVEEFNRVQQAAESTPPVQPDEPMVPVLSSDYTPPAPAPAATVTQLVAYRENRARLREICGTQVLRPAQNSRTETSIRHRYRWDHAGDDWMLVARW